MFSPHGTIREGDNKDLQEDDRIDSDEDDEDLDDSSVEGAHEAEQALQETSAIAYNGAIIAKQHVLNDLINNSFGNLGTDWLAAALSQPRPSHVLDVPTPAHCENMPIAGDLVAAAMSYGTVFSLAILYVRTETDASGRQAMDHSYDVIESSNNLIVHGQLMPFEHRPGPDLHVWNGMLNPRVVQVRGEHCQFVTLESNVENKWYQQTSTLKALAEWCIHCAPTVAPTVPRDPNPCMPTAATGDKVATDSGANIVECQICQRTVPHRVLRTHVGQHILRGRHIQGQAGRSCAKICGVCGSWNECTIRLPLQTRSTRKRMVVAVSSCPSQPSAICWRRT